MRLNPRDLTLRTGLAPLLALLSLLACGCDRNDSRVAVASPTTWRWEAEYFGETDGENRFWETTLSRVQVKLETEDFAGEIRIRIYDVNAALLFDEAYASGSPTSLSLDDNSFAGAPGTWRIRIDVTDAEGIIEIRLVDAGF